MRRARVSWENWRTTASDCIWKRRDLAALIGAASVAAVIHAPLKIDIVTQQLVSHGRGAGVTQHHTRKCKRTFHDTGSRGSRPTHTRVVRIWRDRLRRAFCRQPHCATVDRGVHPAPIRGAAVGGRQSFGAVLGTGPFCLAGWARQPALCADLIPLFVAGVEVYVCRKGPSYGPSNWSPAAPSTCQRERRCRGAPEKLLKSDSSRVTANTEVIRQRNATWLRGPGCSQVESRAGSLAALPKLSPPRRYERPRNEGGSRDRPDRARSGDFRQARQVRGNLERMGVRKAELLDPSVVRLGQLPHPPAPAVIAVSVVVMQVVFGLFSLLARLFHCHAFLRSDQQQATVAKNLSLPDHFHPCPDEPAVSPSDDEVLPLYSVHQAFTCSGSWSYSISGKRSAARR
jgi:hypothetical protein